MDYLFQFGNYILPRTIRPDGDQPKADLAEQELPRRAGSSAQAGRQKSLPLSARGALASDSPGGAIPMLDSLKAGLIGQGEQRLYFGRDDRYYVAQYESVASSSKDGRTWGQYFDVAINFRASDPYAFALANSPTWTATALSGDTIDYAGTAEAKPVWTLTVGTAGTGSIMISNSTTGETATLTGTFAAGDVITLTRDGYKVALNGVATFGMLDGSIPSLIPGVNDITVSCETVTASSLTAGWVERYV